MNPLRRTCVPLLGILLCFSACSDISQQSTRVGSAESRAALFDTIVEKTFAREAFSTIKNERLGIDIRDEMDKVRAEVIQADTDEKLFYSLVKLSNARKDRHLSVGPVDNGLLPKSWNGASLDQLFKEAPIRFAIDYSSSAFDAFVVDLSDDLESLADAEEISTGDLLLEVNGQPFEAYRRSIEPYVRYSTAAGFQWKIGELISQRVFHVPSELYKENITYRLLRRNGQEYTITLPYRRQEENGWQNLDDPSYHNFELISDWQTFDFYVHRTKPVILLDWYGFREDLVRDIDALILYAIEHQLLDYSMVVDATRSRGGSKGAYAIQALSPKPFKTTFGNVRLSDVIEPFVIGKRAEHEAGKMDDSGVSETIDDGSWLMDWLDEDVMPALRRGDHYSNDVPFKLAHAPKDSDGVLQPAAIHFTGDLVVLLGPNGGSHLDQFASIIADNHLGYIIGMPAGGYSNTWEWEETLVMPGTEQPLVSFMWSIGHTIRPNGEILEGNPAEVDEYVPLTRSNTDTYRDDLLARALVYLDSN